MSYFLKNQFINIVIAIVLNNLWFKTLKINNFMITVSLYETQNWHSKCAFYE